MSLVVVGLSHKTAPIELREKLAVPLDELTSSLLALHSSGFHSEVVILSTCNRFEIYARPVNDHQRSIDSLREYFSSRYKNSSVSSAIYVRKAVDAISHLFRVAAGLDSLVVGETEILGQVKSSYRLSQEQGTTGKITNVLFQRALYVGKAVRTKTGISEGGSSVGSMAVQLAEKIFGRLDHHRVLLLGAGKMAEITARHLLSQKADHLVILNRTESKASELATLLGGRAGSLNDIERELMLADIVIGSLKTEKPILTSTMVNSVMKSRGSRSLYFIDIGVPRNIDPTVHDLENVYVYNIDDLKSLVEENINARKKELVIADSMVQQMSDEFNEWLEATLAGQTRPLRHKSDSL